jgi:hypothetical protein
MALIITPTEEQKIYIQGTTIELNQIYNRLEFVCRPNGLTMEISFNTYLDKTYYTNQTPILSDLPTRRLLADIDPLTQSQSVQSAHELAKTWYESLGYVVTIDLT